MELPDFEELERWADTSRPAATVAVAGAADPTVLAAVAEAQRRGWIEPILVGRVAEIQRVAHDGGIDLGSLRILDSATPAETAVAEVRAGRARLLMKGQIATPELMKGVLNSANGLRTGRTLCQIVLMQVRLPDGPATRRFLLADTGLCIQPSLEQKLEILASMVEVAHALGAPEPRIALMAATEKTTEAMPETLDWAELQRRNAAGELPGCVVQGPLSFDLAFAADAGDRKRIGGAVVGAADGMLFPNLLSANLTVKAIMYTAACRFGGVVRGAACPIVFMSRADSTATRLNSLALSLRLLNDLRDPESK